MTRNERIRVITAEQSIDGKEHILWPPAPNTGAGRAGRKLFRRMARTRCDKTVLLIRRLGGLPA